MKLMSIGEEYIYNVLEWPRIGSSSVKIDSWALINSLTQVKDYK